MIHFLKNKIVYSWHFATMSHFIQLYFKSEKEIFLITNKTRLIYNTFYLLYNKYLYSIILTLYNLPLKNKNLMQINFQIHNKELYIFVFINKFSFKYDFWLSFLKYIKINRLFFIKITEYMEIF